MLVDGKLDILSKLVIVNLPFYIHPSIGRRTVQHVSMSYITPYDCSYERSWNESTIMDITESVHGFALGTWILVLSALMVLSMLIKMNARVHGKKIDSAWTIFSFLFKNPSFNEFNTTSRIMHALIALFCFFVGVCYFENTIKTDKVSVYQPTVYTSLEQILSDPRAQILDDMGAIGSMFSKPAFLQYWKYRDTFAKQKVIFSTTNTMSDYMKWIYSENVDNKVIITWLSRSDFRYCNLNVKRYAKMIGAERTDGTICFHDYRPLMNGEEVGADSEEGFIYSRTFWNKRLFIKYSKYVQRAEEMGILGEGHFTQIQVTPSTYDCMPKRNPKTWDRDFEVSELSFYSKALLSLLGPFFSACFVLLYEHSKNW